MTLVKLPAILAFFFCATLLAACGGGGNKPVNLNVASNHVNENSNGAKTSVEDLGLIIKIPYDTEDIAWKVDAARKKVIAVLRFSPEDSAKLVADAEKIRPSEPVNIIAEAWFPNELTAPTEMSGDDNLKGRSYAADQFFQEPYTSGRIVRIENTDYFILELSSK